MRSASAFTARAGLLLYLMKMANYRSNVMAAGVLEQLPQVLGAAAAFMLGWAACDWVKTRQARKDATSEPADRIESSAGDAEPINTGADNVTKVNISDSDSVSPQCHAGHIDVTVTEEGQQAVEGHGIVEPSAEAGQDVAAGAVNEPTYDVEQPDEPVYQDAVIRHDSVRVTDSLISVQNAE